MGVLPFPLLLTGCFNPHTINDQDAVYCESKGLPRGTDANAQCAMQHREEQAQAGIAPRPLPIAPEAAGAPPPPSHPGSIPQTTPRTVTAGVTTTINFSFSVNADCTANGLPVVRIDKQPAHGVLKTVPRDDFARLSQSSFPLACGDKKVRGIALEYTPNKDYAGADSIEFETMAQLGAQSGLTNIFKVPITVRKPPPPDDF